VPETKPQGRSLAAFVHEKRKQDCKVCALSPEIREEMIQASKKKIRQADVIEWLRAEQGVSLDDSDLASHYSGKHDRVYS
jgi:hypothetical protein